MILSRRIGQSLTNCHNRLVFDLLSVSNFFLRMLNAELVFGRLHFQLGIQIHFSCSFES